MTAEEKLYAALAGLAGLTALVGLRISPDALPENEALPAIVFVRASTNPTYTIGGVLVAEDVHFVITAWAKSRTEAEPIGDQIRLALEADGYQIADRSSGFDNEVGLFAVSIEFDMFVS
jgi:hypothetical protein